jgi:hypothetical protein
VLLSRCQDIILLVPLPVLRQSIHPRLVDGGISVHQISRSLSQSSTESRKCNIFHLRGEDHKINPKTKHYLILIIIQQKAKTPHHKNPYQNKSDFYVISTNMTKIWEWIEIFLKFNLHPMTKVIDYQSTIKTM